MSTRQYLLPRSGGMPVLEGVRLVYITSAQYSAEWSSSPHTHTCAELFFITGGRGAFQIQVNSGVPHTEVSGEPDPMGYTVLGVEGLEALSGPGGYALIHGFSQQHQVAQCLDMLTREAEQARPGYEVVCQDLLHVLLMLLLRRREFVPQAAPGVQRSSRECSLVRRYMDSHFKENITLDQLAALAHLNKFYLAHAFQKEYGISPMRYLTARRIRESRFLLTETDHSLSHIAQVLGFSSPSYFSQCFRRMEGVSPKEYRQLHRQKAGQSATNAR